MCGLMPSSGAKEQTGRREENASLLIFSPALPKNTERGGETGSYLISVVEQEDTHAHSDTGNWFQADILFFVVVFFYLRMSPPGARSSQVCPSVARCARQPLAKKTGVQEGRNAAAASLSSLPPSPDLSNSRARAHSHSLSLSLSQ